MRRQPGVVLPLVTWCSRVSRELAGEGSPAFAWFVLSMAAASLASGWAVVAAFNRPYRAIGAGFIIDEVLGELAEGRSVFLAALADTAAP